MDIRTARLQQAFRDSGLSQTDVCEKASISKGAFSSYLSGRYFPKQRVLEKLSLVLRVPITYLMGLPDCDYEASDGFIIELTSHDIANEQRIRRLSAYLTELTDDQLSLIEQMVEQMRSK